MASVGAWSRAATAWLGTVGRPALRRALRVWLGAGVLGAIFLGGTGVMPRDLARIGVASPGVMVGLALAWLVLLAPAMRGAIGGPGVALLRSLPGAGLLEALAVSAVALAIHAPWGALAVMGAGGRGAASWLGLAAASLIAAIAMARLPVRRRVPRWGSSLAALVGVHARAVTRRRGGSLGFGVGLAVLAGALGGALSRSGGLDGAGAATLVSACVVVAVAIGLAAIAAVVVDDRRALTAWIAAAAPAAWATRGALAIVLGGLGLGLGAVSGGAAIVVGGLGARAGLGVVGAGAAAGLGVGAALAALAEPAAGSAAPGLRIAVSAVAVAVVGVAVLGYFGGLGVIALALVGLGLAAGGGAR